MSPYINTSGYASCSVAICDKCHMKKPYSLLVADGNSPGLRVCPTCSDNLDPWRMTPRQSEDITLRFPRPDEPLTA